MITCEYMGRLGNNMFQIATTLAMAKKYSENAVFAPHPNFPWLPKREQQIENTLVAPKTGNLIFDIPYKENMTLVGFFQRHEYFDHIKNELIEYFRVTNDWYPGTTAIHVRRGDFLFDTVNFPPVTIEYINKALSLIKNKDKIVFCSDDIHWCRENFSNLHNVSFRENIDSLADIYFMTNCDNVIMSNSTFSFWGAYLSNRDRQIIFPLHWFDLRSKRNGHEICPKNWMGI